MVLGVCRQILGDRHHAEDAFQAVFLVLACKARSIRQPDLLGNLALWSGARTAQVKKTGRCELQKREESDVMCVPGAVKMVEPMVSSADVSAMALEHAEKFCTTRSPGCLGSFRLPVLLCYFEG